MYNQSNKFEQFHGDSKLFHEANSRKIDILVFHHTQAKSINEAVNLYKKYGVSAHYIIDETGEIFLLVEEENIAFHAGFSYWNGFYDLNKNSIGIELLSANPWQIGFNKKQISSLINLASDIKTKYQILNQNIVGHSDIAYDNDTKLLGRKQDPSYLFKWQVLAKKDIGFFTNIMIDIDEDKILFKKNDNQNKLIDIKKKLNLFGYHVKNFDANFDEEMAMLCYVFNLRFNSKKFIENPHNWYLSSQLIIDELLKLAKIPFLPSK